MKLVHITETLRDHSLEVEIPDDADPTGIADDVAWYLRTNCARHEKKDGPHPLVRVHERDGTTQVIEHTDYEGFYGRMESMPRKGCAFLTMFPRCADHAVDARRTLPGA